MHAVPGAAIGILREGVATTAYHGVGPGARFRVGSLTKSMVATVVARLADAGRLSLDDPVAAHAPELQRSTWAESATVRDLLANRSGLPLRDRLEFGFDDRTGEDDGALARLVADIPANEPRAGFWSYSNIGFCVLGRVIEAASGAAWEDAMRTSLFSEVGMHETTFWQSGGRAYAPAGTTVVSTTADMLRFAALHLEDSSLATLRDVQAEISIHSWFDSWCLGWARFDWRGGPVWGWDGLIDDQRSVLRLLPEQQAAVVLLTNSASGRAMYRSLFAELMPSLFGVSVATLRLDAAPGSAGDLSRYAGTYAWPDRQVEVRTTTDGLLIGEQEALPVDKRTFVVDDHDPDNPTVTFGAFDTAGRPQVLYVMLWGLPRKGAPCMST